MAGQDVYVAGASSATHQVWIPLLLNGVDYGAAHLNLRLQFS